MFVRSLLLVACLCSAAAAQTFPIFEYNPAGSITGKGIYQDVYSRTSPAGRKAAYMEDRVIYAHELTHQIDSEITVDFDSPTFSVYMGNGKYTRFLQPSFPLSRVAALVPKELHTDLYNLTFTSRINGHKRPLYLLDEWNAYIVEAQHSVETRDPGRNLPGGWHEDGDRGSFANAKSCAYYSDLMLQVIRRDQPNYPDLEPLSNFIEWQKKRVAILLNVK